MKQSVIQEPLLMSSRYRNFRFKACNPTCFCKEPPSTFDNNHLYPTQERSDTSIFFQFI